MIIGLTGKNGSGKGEVASFLKERGFHYHSLSDALRDEARKQGKEITRGILVELGNFLREQEGPGCLAERIFAKLDPEKHYVVDSIRHPSEVQVFRRRNDFTLLRVHAPERLRFERLKQRGRENDPRVWEEFQALEVQEAKSEHKTDQQLDLAIAAADLQIDNNGPLRELHEKVKAVLLDIAKAAPRPSWDDYFMNIAKVTALRSNCMKRKVAAVIIKDKRIISTGYNGTPRGVTNCNEGGCPRCAAIDASGKDLGECLCSHGEENAIVQAAYHGVSVKGATLYTTFSPCLLCTKMIINAGIAEVVFQANYPMSDLSLKLLSQAGVLVRKIPLPT
ncbi:MAG: dephospho-CoA kinase [Candidatus Omnitrophica bacterium]|nr:dephospho-CoA kinase [Candidatus Omnitrophota bacterium]